MFTNILIKNMKIIKINHFFFLFTFLIIISCKKDDESTPLIDEAKSENLKPLGASAADLLSQNTYSSLTLELAFTIGFRPSQEAIDDFKSFLESRINKPGGIVFVETEIITPFVESQTIDDIRKIEDEQRIHYTVADDIAIFIYFSHAKASTDSKISVTLGTAYRNTSVVIYQQTIREVSISQNSDLYVLEETTLQHEIGHLFGLVNIQEDDIHSEHEDLAHRKHCKVEDCLMYFETNLPGSFRNRINVPSLDSLCMEDLQAKGGK